MTLSGTFMLTDYKNSNGHLYKAEAIADAFKEYQNKVNTGEAYGKFTDINHPEKSFETNLKDITHRVTEVNWDVSTGEVFGKIELFEDTPNGKIAQKILSETGSLSIAPSMLVEKKENSEYRVSQLYSFDICSESAWPDAKVKPI